MKEEATLNNPVIRYPLNPIITPNDINKIWTNPELQVVTVHNAGVCIHGNETIMLFRSHLRSGMSIIGIAKSKDGITNWKINPKPVLMPENDDEEGGLEDPRITKIENEYAITYNAYHGKIKNQVKISLITTKDFKSFIRHGQALKEEARNMAIFPEKINGKFCALFRLNDKNQDDTGGKFTEMLIGFSKDFKKGPWKLLENPIIKTGHGPSAIQDKIGPGAPPIKTEKGWLNIFHGVRTTMNGNPYVLTVALHDLKNPTKVKRSNIPILFPTKADINISKNSYIHVPEVVFTCGAIKKPNGKILIYYGGDDTVMDLGFSNEKILIELCEKYQQNPLTGEVKYLLK
jgi:predicted GH43/DUF377 family glycosyl hydrolase